MLSLIQRFRSSLRIAAVLTATLAAGWLCLTNIAAEKTLPEQGAIADAAYDSPRSIYRRFRQAISERDWAAEYECYTADFQDHLLYRVVLLALHLEFDMDLFLQAEEALERHGIPDADLAAFWPNANRRVILFAGDDPAPLKEWEAEIQARMDQWREAVRPHVTDAAELIAELQPLIMTSGKRHPQSTIAKELETYGHHAFGRIRKMEQNGETAQASIRTKTLNGYFIAADSLAQHAAGDEGSAAPFRVLSPDIQCRLHLVDPNCYTEIWQAASQLQLISDTLPKYRFAIIGMLTGDVAVELNEGIYEAEGQESDEDILTVDDFGADAEEAEFDLPNNGTRTVSESNVAFRRVDGRWLIEEISYR